VTPGLVVRPSNPKLTLIVGHLPLTLNTCRTKQFFSDFAAVLTDVILGKRLATFSSDFDTVAVHKLRYAPWEGFRALRRSYVKGV